jgi:hypothetical protein
MEKRAPKQDLLAEYEKLAKESTDPEARFLLARILEEPESFKLMKEAAIAKPPSIYAQAAVGNRESSLGHFKVAVEWLNKSCQAKPNNYLFFRFRREALLANKDYEQILTGTPPVFPGGEDEDLLYKLQAALKKGDPQQIQQLQQQMNPRVGVLMRPNQPSNNAKLVDPVIAAVKVDFVAYVRSARLANPGESVETLLLQGKPEEALKLPQTKNDRDSIARKGLIYLKARDSKKQNVADDAWKALIESLNNEDRDIRLFADYLQSKDEAVVEKMLQCFIEPNIKRVLLLVGADRFPKSKDKLQSLAMTLNFNSDGVSLCMKQILRKK